jgi:hypothetical protein
VQQPKECSHGHHEDTVSLEGPMDILTSQLGQG